MNGWLFVAILRLMGGERFRKATPQDYRYHSASFLFIPVFLILGAKLGQHFLDRASAARIWVFMTCYGTAWIFFILFWSKHVSAKISWTLGGIAWAVTVFLALNNRLLGP